MAAPTVTARPTPPAGYKLPDGFSSVLVFAFKPAVALWIVTTKPPGLDAKEAIDTTTMYNKRLRTMAARKLVTMTEATFTAAYDPDVYTDLVALIGHEGSITHYWPEDTGVAFYGFLQKVEFGELKEGTFPEITGTITPTNTDPVNFTEELPVVVPASGT